MKRFIPLMITIVLMSLSLRLSAQSADPIPSIFDKYEERDGVESITISPSLLGLMKNGRTNDKKTQDLISKISGLRVLTIADKSGKEMKNLREQLLTELKPVLQKEYEQFMKVKSDNQVELYIRKNAGKESGQKSALLFITSENRSVTVIHIAGMIDKELIDAVMNGEIGTSK